MTLAFRRGCECTCKEMNMTADKPWVTQAAALTCDDEDKVVVYVRFPFALDAPLASVRGLYVFDSRTEWWLAGVLAHQVNGRTMLYEDWFCGYGSRHQ